MSREDFLRTATPHFIADVTFRTMKEGGKVREARLGWGCLCVTSDTRPFAGWDAWPLLGEEPMNAGEHRRLGFHCLSDEGARALATAGRFYLCEGAAVVGEAVVVATSA